MKNNLKKTVKDNLKHIIKIKNNFQTVNSQEQLLCKTIIDSEIIKMIEEVPAILIILII